MRYLVLFFGCMMVFILTGCRTGTMLFVVAGDQQAQRTADTIREICNYPSYDTVASEMEQYRTIIAALLLNRNDVEQTEPYRTRLIQVITETGISTAFADRITKVIVYGYMQEGKDSEFSYYLKRLLFHLDQRQNFYDPYSNITFTPVVITTPSQP